MHKVMNNEQGALTSHYYVSLKTSSNLPTPFRHPRAYYYYITLVRSSIDLIRVIIIIIDAVKYRTYLPHLLLH